MAGPPDLDPSQNNRGGCALHMPRNAGTGSFIWAIEWKEADVEKLQLCAGGHRFEGDEGEIGWREQQLRGATVCHHLTVALAGLSPNARLEPPCVLVPHRQPLESAVMAGKDAGVPVTCPGCGETVLQKPMIPVLGEGGNGITYLCPACARKLVDTAAKDVAQTEGEAEEPGT